ncbi:MAG: radical SAM protein, partial [Actinobacteria bacterium]|nr:radical SAM protein [Actinomycetota bacterium]
ITTNAYTLTLPVCHRLREVGVRQYQVSLDGPREFHDRTRIRAAGGPSFDRIWANLLSVRASPLDVSVVLRIHLSPSNMAALPAFLSTIKSTFLTDSRFSVFLKCVEPLGGPHDSELDFISHTDRSGILERLTDLLFEGCPDSAVTQPDVCYASKPNSLVIRPNGSVAKCTVALSDDANNVGYLDSDGRVHLDNVRLAPWLRGWQSGDPSVLSCPLDEFPAPTRWNQRDSTKRNLIPLVDVSPRR